MSKFMPIGPTYECLGDLTLSEYLLVFLIQTRVVVS